MSETDDMSVGDLVDNIAATISDKPAEGTADQGQAGTAGQTGEADASAATGSQVEPPKQDELQPKIGEDGKPIEPTADQGSNPIVDEAIAYMETLIGRKLSDAEVVEEMSRSVVNSTAKTKQLTEDIKDLATRNQTWETWYTENNIEGLIKVISDPRVQSVIEEVRTGVRPQGEDYGFEEIPPAVQKEIAGLKSQLAKYENSSITREQTEKQQAITKQQGEYQKTITEFAAKNPDYKQELDAYAERCKLNPYAKLPDKLLKWDKMVRSGVEPQDAWDVINKDKLAERIQADIAKRQGEKGNAPKILPRGGQKPPVKTYEEADTFDQFFNTVIERAGQNGR